MYMQIHKLTYHRQINFTSHSMLAITNLSKSFQAEFTVFWSRICHIVVLCIRIEVKCSKLYKQLSADSYWNDFPNQLGAFDIWRCIQILSHSMLIVMCVLCLVRASAVLSVSWLGQSPTMALCTSILIGLNRPHPSSLLTSLKLEILWVVWIIIMSGSLTSE